MHSAFRFKVTQNHQGIGQIADINILCPSFTEKGTLRKDEKVSLPIENGTLAARTIILSGTSDGVLMRKPSARRFALGFLEVAAGGLRDVQATLIERTFREAHEERRYLQPGMQVVMRADKLGIIRNRIVS